MIMIMIIDDNDHDDDDYIVDNDDDDDDDFIDDSYLPCRSSVSPCRSVSATNSCVAGEVGGQ